MNKTVLFFFLLILLTYSSFSKQDKILADSSGWTPVNGYFEQKYHVGAFQKVKLAADPRYLLTYSSDSMFRKWEISSGNLVYEKKYDFNGNQFLDFTNDEKYFVLYNFAVGSGNPYYSFYLYDINKDTIIMSIDSSFTGSGYNINNDGAFSVISYDNRSIFIAIHYNNSWKYVDYFGDLIVLDLDSFKFKKMFSTNSSSIAFSKNNKYSAFNSSLSWYHENQSFFSSGLYFLDDSLNITNLYYLTNMNGDHNEIIYYNKPYFSDNSDIMAANSGNSLYLWSVPDLKRIDSINLPNYFSSRICRNNEFIFYYAQSDTLRTINLYHRKSHDNILLFDLNDGSNPYQIYLYPVSDTSFIGAGDDGILRLFFPQILSKSLKANFISDFKIIYTDSLVHFYDISNGNYTYRHWDFGNGDTSSEKEPIIKYTNIGKYTVILIVGDGIHNDTLTMKDYVEVKPNLIADFSFVVLSDHFPTNVQFTDKSKGDIKSWKWDFGDGPTSNEQNPLHTYQNWGNYAVTLTVYDSTYYRSKVLNIWSPNYPIKNLIFENFLSAGPNWKGTQGLELMDGSLFVHGWYKTLVLSDKGYYIGVSDARQLIVKNTGNYKIINDLPFSSGYGYNAPDFAIADYFTQIHDSSLIGVGFAGYMTTKMNVDGNIIWQKSGQNGQAIGIINRLLDNYLVLSRLDSNNMNYLVLSEFDSSGKSIHRDLYQQYYIFGAGKLINTLDSGFAYSIYNNNNNSLFYYRNVKGSNFIDYEDFRRYNSLIETNDSCFILAGSKFIYGIKHAYIVKIDKLGGEIWNFVMDSSKNSFNDIVSLSKKYFLVTGDFEWSTGYYIFNTDGHPVDSSFFPNRPAVINSVIKTTDNSIFMVGTFYPTKDINNSAIYYLKIGLDSMYIDKSDTAVNPPPPTDTLKYDFSVFPNPFTSQLNVNITLPQSEFVKFSIYNELGQEVAALQDNDYVAGSKQFNIDFSDKSIGVYFYKLQVGTNIYTGTLIHYR